MIKASFTPLSLIIVSVVLLFFSLIFIMKIKPLIKNEQIGKQSQLKLMKEGLSYIINNSALKSLFIFLALAMFFATSVDLILVSFLSDILLEGVENLSFIGTASLCGIAIGATLFPKFYNDIGRKWLFISPLFALSISIGSLFFITNWVVILPFFFIQGIALGCFNVAFVTYLQNTISSENYTRTFSIYNMLSSSMALPGIIMTGLLLNQIGVLNTILIISGALFLIGILGIYFTPKLEEGQTLEISKTNATIN